jgi:hypothetical protein
LMKAVHNIEIYLSKKSGWHKSHTLLSLSL